MNILSGSAGVSWREVSSGKWSARTGGGWGRGVFNPPVLDWPMVFEGIFLIKKKKMEMITS